MTEILDHLYQARDLLVSATMEAQEPTSPLYCTMAARSIEDAADQVTEAILRVKHE